MVLLASLCINMLFVLMFDYTKNFDRIHHEQNGEDNIFVFSSTDLSALENTVCEKLNNREGVEAYDLLPVQYFWGGCKYGDGTLLSTILPAKKTCVMKKNVGKYTIAFEDPSVSGVYLPYSFYSSGYYHIGDDFKLTDNANTECVNVAGFYYSSMADSQNCYMITLIFDDEVFERVSQTFSNSGLMVSVKTGDITCSKALERELPEEIVTAVPDGYLATQNIVESVKQSRYVMYFVATALIGTASVVLLILTSVSLNIYLSNYVRERRRVIGVLKALGYTDSVISRSIVELFLLVTAVCSVLGMAAFYGVFPILNRFFEGQIGLPYTVHFIPFLSAGTLLILLAGTCFIAEISLNAVKKISPVNAIRSLGSASSGQKTRFRLKKTRLPLNLALSANDLLIRKRQSVVIMITMLLISFNLVIMMMLFHTGITVSDNLTGVMFGESCDISAVVAGEAKDQFIRELSEDSDIESFLSYDVLKVDHKDGQRLQALIISDGEKLNNKDIYYEGSYPQNAYEVAIGGKYAKENHIRIGDVLTFSVDKSTAEFTVCGFSQSVRYLGNDSTFTLDGYERMKKLDTNQYYITLNKNVDRETKVDAMRQQPITLNVSDVEAYKISTVGRYIDVVKVVSLMLSFLCLTVVIFVLYHLTVDILRAKERTYGIMKALGFTTKDLITQTVSEICVPVTVSTVIGLTVSHLLEAPLVRLFVYRVGIVKNCFEAPISWIVLSGFLLILSVLFLEVCLTLKIRKLSPKMLFGDK